MEFGFLTLFFKNFKCLSLKLSLEKLRLPHSQIIYERTPRNPPDTYKDTINVDSELIVLLTSRDWKVPSALAMVYIFLIHTHTQT